MPTLSLAMIVKNESDTIERVLEVAKPFCDELIVVDTGSTDDTVVKARAMGAMVHPFTWIDDFSAARNFSFSHCTKDWIIWLDGDDVITPENQQRILDLKHQVLNDELEAAYLRYHYPPFTQWRERIIRRALFGTKLEWRGPIHECINGMDMNKVRFCPAISIQHDPPANRSARKKDRNITILRRHYHNGAHDERTLYIYALECLNNLRKEEGENILAAFFATAKYSPYKYELYHRMYDFYIDLGEPARALDALSRAIVEDPKCAEAYYKLGKHILDKKDDPRGALPLLHTATTITLPDYGMPEMVAYTYGPWEALCRAYFRLENYALAKEMARKALQYNPPHSDWITKLVDYDTHGFPAEPLPDSWQAWLEDNIINRAVPHHILIRILKDNHFSPGQIITGLQIVRAREHQATAVDWIDGSSAVTARAQRTNQGHCPANNSNGAAAEPAPPHLGMACEPI